MASRSGRTDPVAGPAVVGTSVPRWLILSSLGLALLGLGMAGYLAYEHHTASTTLSCPDTGVINCLKVTTSTYSRFLGLPVSDIGVVYFLAMALLCQPSSWASPGALLRRTRLALAAAGALFVLYLLWAELFQLDAICLWCTAVHVVTVALFGVLVIGTAMLDQHG
jgi:uncharacterized membrane protein